MGISRITAGVDRLTLTKNHCAKGSAAHNENEEHEHRRSSNRSKDVSRHDRQYTVDQGCRQGDDYLAQPLKLQRLSALSSTFPGKVRSISSFTEHPAPSKDKMQE